MNVNQRQYQLLLQLGFVLKEQLDQALPFMRSTACIDLCDFLVRSQVLSSENAESVRGFAVSSNSPFNLAGKAPSLERKISLENFEELFAVTQGEEPLFSPHARAQFKLIEKLGEGGMGVVHRIEDKKLGRTAALKVLSSGGADERAVTRFIREAQITASLVHPNIPPVYELGKNSSGEHYMLMKVIEGQSLKEAINEVHCGGNADPKEIRRLLEALVKVCEAMAYAHSKEVIHRDLKPENIMIGEFGEVMVLDWGLARDFCDKDEDESIIVLDSGVGLELRAAAQKEGLTGARDLLGTVGYMAPEQVDGRACKQSDVFALGAILTEILTGKAAVSGEGMVGKISATIQGRFRSPRDISEAVSRELDSLACEAMKVNLEERTECVTDILLDLRAYLEGTELKTYHYSLRERTRRWVSKYPALLVLAVGSVLLLLTLSTLFSNLETVEVNRDVAVQAELEATEKRRLLKKSSELFREAAGLVAEEIRKERLIEILNRALEYGGRAESQLLAAARILKRAKHYNESVEILQEVERRFSPAYEALYLMHLIAIRDEEDLSRNSESLEKLYQLAKKNNDENEFTLLVEAQKAAILEEWESVLSFNRRALSYTTKNSEIYRLNGLALIGLGKYEESLKNLNIALTLNPKSVNSLALRGFVFGKMGELDKALTNFNLALRIAPDNSSLYYHRGVIYSWKRKNCQALWNYTSSIQLDSERVSAYFNRGVVWTDLGNWKNGDADFQKALELDPTHQGACFNLGNSKLRQGYAQIALALYDRSAAAGMKLSGLYVNRGIAKKHLGDIEGAIAELGVALQLNPESAEAFRTRAGFYLKQSKLQEAGLDFEQSLRWNPKEPDAAKTRAMVRKLLGRDSHY